MAMLIRIAFAFLALTSVTSAQIVEGDHVDERPGDTFVLARKGDPEVRIRGPRGELGQTVAKKHNRKADALYIHRAGTDYVVTDPELVADARTAWDAVIESQRKQEAAGKDLDPGKQDQRVAQNLEKLRLENARAVERLEHVLEEIATDAFTEGAVAPM